MGTVTQYFRGGQDVMRKGKSYMRKTALSDNHVEYQLNAFLLRPEKRIGTLVSLHANIQDTFN